MKKLGRYLILEEVGRGSMGRIYRARDPEIDRVVAIKTIAVEGFGLAPEAEFRQRFLREAKAAGKLLHPGIVAIFDVGEDSETGTPFIVMEYIEGRTLQEVGAHQQLPRDKALELVRQLAEALDYAHREGIVHRDIKPANIIVTGEGRAKIADFGVAKLQAIELTQTGMMMGTPTYMSPEQTVGEAVDGRSDLFSLVTVLYWLLTGERPFVGNNMATLTFNIVHKEPKPPSSLEPTLSKQFDQVVARGLAKEPGGRYQTGRELADDLDDLLNGRPLRSQARPRPEAHKATVSSALSPIWGRPGLLALMAVIVLLLVIGGVSWQSSQPGGAIDAQPTADATPSVVPVPEDPAGQPVPSGPAATQGVTPQRSPSRKAVRRESRPQPLPTATVRLEGEHAFEQATLSFYADGKLLERISLQTTGAPAQFAAQASLPPGDKVLSVTMREEGETRTERGYLQGSFAQGQTRTLRVTFDPRGRMELRWAD
jgi:serine/threonine-protein kinase